MPRWRGRQHRAEIVRGVPDRSPIHRTRQAIRRRVGSHLHAQHIQSRRRDRRQRGGPALNGRVCRWRRADGRKDRRIRCVGSRAASCDVITVPVESTCVTKNVSPSICSTAGMPLGGAVALARWWWGWGGGGCCACCCRRRRGVVAAGWRRRADGQLLIAALSARTDNPPGPSQPLRSCVAGAERVTVSIVPVASVVVTVIISESTYTRRCSPRQRRVKVICLSVVPTVLPRCAIFAADASNEPGGRLATFWVRVALSVTVTF